MRYCTYIYRWTNPSGLLIMFEYGFDFCGDIRIESSNFLIHWVKNLSSDNQFFKTRFFSSCIQEIYPPPPHILSLSDYPINSYQRSGSIQLWVHGVIINSAESAILFQILKSPKNMYKALNIKHIGLSFTHTYFAKI